MSTVRTQSRTEAPVAPVATGTPLPAISEIITLAPGVSVRADEITALLPNHVPLQKFLAVASVAIQNNSTLLKVSPVVLVREFSKAAIDGLIPDGREAVINAYLESYKDEKDAWQKRWTCSFIPMLYGIRKRAQELAGIIIDAQVVHAKDSFDWQQGTHPVIIHRPCQDKDPGPMRFAYAVFKRGNEILHQEVLRENDIAAIKSTVKASNGLMWKTFEGEAWKRSAVKRGAKTVPAVPSELSVILDRSNVEHDLTGQHEKLTAEPKLPPRLAVPQAPQPKLPPRVTTDAPTTIVTDVDAEPTDRNEVFLVELGKRLGSAKSLPELNEKWNRNETTVEQKLPADHKKRAYEIYDEHEARIIKAKDGSA
ncbi:MAG: recombinase RecT [Hyphomicrobiaceae bacterium]|nr:hypothetical protein [Hyphomicrobiaceae bacterium]